MIRIDANVGSFQIEDRETVQLYPSTGTWWGTAIC